MNAKYNFFKIILENLGVEIKDERVYDLCNAVCMNFVEFTGEPTEPPSSCVVALASNSGASFPNAAAAGLNCISDKHLLIQEIGDFIEENYRDSATEVYYSNYGEIFPGFGHPSIKGEDSRVRFLIDEFNDLAGERTRFLLNLEGLLSSKSRPVKMNIGGAISCLLLDAGIPKEYVLYFPLIGRLFGWLKIFNATKNNFSNVKPSQELLKALSAHEH
jgi:citrate synthase